MLVELEPHGAERDAAVVLDESRVRKSVEIGLARGYQVVPVAAARDLVEGRDVDTALREHQPVALCECRSVPRDLTVEAHGAVFRAPVAARVRREDRGGGL